MQATTRLAAMSPFATLSMRSAHSLILYFAASDEGANDFYRDESIVGFQNSRENGKSADEK